MSSKKEAILGEALKALRKSWKLLEKVRIRYYCLIKTNRPILRQF